MPDKTQHIYLYRIEEGTIIPPGFKQLAPMVIASESRHWPVLSIEEAAALQVSIYWIKKAFPDFAAECERNRPKI